MGRVPQVEGTAAPPEGLGVWGRSSEGSVAEAGDIHPGSETPLEGRLGPCESREYFNVHEAESHKGTFSGSPGYVT